MKPINLTWVLVLAGAMAACNSGPPITGEPPDNGGDGGSGGSGTGGTGGSLQGECTTPENEAVFAELSFTNSKGQFSEGTEAASAIGSECVRGSADSDPPVAGCPNEVADIIGCLAGGCPQETIDALAGCVEVCVQDTIETIVGSTIDEGCTGCYGGTVACGAAYCTGPCLASTTAPECIACRCDNDCTPNFVVCSGIPSNDC